MLRDSCLHGKCKYKLMYWIGCGCALWYIDIFNIASITDILRIIRSLLHMLERLSVYNWRTVDSTISRITADLIYIIFCYQTNARSSAVAERQHDAWCRCRFRQVSQGRSMSLEIAACDRSCTSSYSCCTWPCVVLLPR